MCNEQKLNQQKDEADEPDAPQSAEMSTKCTLSPMSPIAWQTVTCLSAEDQSGFEASRMGSHLHESSYIIYGTFALHCACNDGEIVYSMLPCISTMSCDQWLCWQYLSHARHY